MARAAAAVSGARGHLQRSNSDAAVELANLRVEEQMFDDKGQFQTQGEETWTEGILDALDPEQVVNELIPHLEATLDVLRPMAQAPDVDRQASYMSVASETERMIDRLTEEATRLNNNNIGTLEYLWGQAKLQQIKLRLWYDSDNVQMAVALVIVMNFFTAALGITNWAMTNDNVGHTLESIDQIFLYIFLVELIINFLANFFWIFITSGWAWFDSVVVIMPLMTSMYAMSALRVIRILRVVKIFRTAKFDFVRVIIGTILLSLKSVIPIFAVLFGVSVCFCIVAVSLLSGKEDFPSGFTVDDHFHDLRHALLTCFQLMTYDSWTAVVRPLAVEESWWWGLLWSCYVFITGFLLCNMFVAVLCTEMERQMDEQKKRKEIAELKKRKETRMLNQVLTTHSQVASNMLPDRGYSGHGSMIQMPGPGYDDIEYPQGLESPREDQPGQMNSSMIRQESEEVNVLYSPRREKMLTVASMTKARAGASSGSFESQVLQMLGSLRQNQSALEASVTNLRDQVGTLTAKLANVKGIEGLERSTSVVDTSDQPGMGSA